jgi:asparagine synthase (glutamine-hydrolysing)
MAPGQSSIDAALLADQQYHLPAGLLMKSDSMTMAHGLEARVPLLDRRIIAFAGRCHPSLLTGITGDSKRVLREALRMYGMPDSVVRAPKRGFNSPLARMLRTSLREHGQRLFVHEPDVFTPFFSAGALRDLWVEHQEQKADHAYALWPLLIFGTWRPTIV